jgi:hypothetical protein
MRGSGMVGASVRVFVPLLDGLAGPEEVSSPPQAEVKNNAKMRERPFMPRSITQTPFWAVERRNKRFTDPQ